MTVAFELEGQEFVALNGGPVFTFSPAISFVVTCETQGEIDKLWEKLSAGGGNGAVRLDPARSQKVMEAMRQMGKLDIEELRRAYQQVSADVRPRRRAGQESGRRSMANGFLAPRDESGVRIR